ncbi:MAG: hypothetical protein Q9222_001235 [Ikaeria aurantiellina]
MLPSAKDSLTQGGFPAQAAAYAVIGCFLGGVVGIQAVSRLMHHFIPSHVVDCDHSHDDDKPATAGDASRSCQKGKRCFDERTPLLTKPDPQFRPQAVQRSMSAAADGVRSYNAPARAASWGQRPSLQTRVSKLVSGAKLACDGDGKCYGYSDPCAQECLKAMSRHPTTAQARPPLSAASQPNLKRTGTAPFSQATHTCLNELDEEEYSASADSSTTRASKSPSKRISQPTPDQSLSQAPDLESNPKRLSSSVSSVLSDDAQQQQHHHHVHTNAFLSIGLQTSIAIALHKLPEGFITYATNHANPRLGFAVFMALFIHNITEGFAMALPLYLAIGSRWKSMFWSSLLGGASQPFGAGVAALWFKVAGTSDRAPGETVYGCMFAITAGIMASVALQLFSESLALNHNRNLCLTFAFIGMGVLGISFALTAG